MVKTRKAGFGIEPPNAKCSDVNCPFHGTLKIRGKQFTGKIVSDKMQKSVTVEWIGWRRIPKYERYKKTKTRVVAHNPACIGAKEGDIVKIGECKPLSKTKNFVVLQIQGKLEKYELEKSAMAEGKHKEKVTEKPEAKTKGSDPESEPEQESEQESEPEGEK